MKKLIYLVMSIAMTLFAADASAQYIPVTTPSSCIVDGSGSTITAGTMIVVGTDANDNPIPYRAGTSAMATTAPISRSIVNGALLTSLQLADPASTSPTNVLYRFVIQDNLSKKITVYKQIIVAINDLGTNFNFCKMNPLPFTTQIQFAAAPFSFSGDWNLLGNLSVALNSNFKSISNIQVLGNGTNTNFSAMATAMGATGAGIVPPSYVGTDNAFVSSNGPPIIDLRPNAQGSIGLWHGIHCMHPVVNFPGGNDCPIDSWGPGDILPANNPVACTSSTTVATGLHTITVGTCADTTGKGGPTGDTSQLSHATGVTLIIDPGTVNEEVILNANWSIASSTTVTATFAKAHTTPYVIWQRGSIQNVTDLFSVTGVLGLSFVDQEIAGNNFFNMAGWVAIRPAGDLSLATQAFDVHGGAISSTFQGETIGDNAANRVNVGYSTASIAGTKIVPAQIVMGTGSSGDLEIGCRGNQPCSVKLLTSPDAGTTGLVQRWRITPSGAMEQTEIAAPSGNALTSTCYPDSTSHFYKCSYNNGTFMNMMQVVTATLTTTAATTDNVTVTGMTSTGHCSLQPTNAGAAGGIASVFISAKTTNQITVTHTATAAWTFDVTCTPQ